MKERDLSIDVMRFIGIALIVVAHVQAPFCVMQVRCFDVPLMLFVSGLAISYKPINNYWQYIKKRALRLLLPVWLFLACYLSSFYYIQSYIWPTPYLTPRMIVRSFLLLDQSIGYVWIIRVFLVVMLVTPFWKYLTTKFSNLCFFLSFEIFLLFCSHLLYIFITPLEHDFSYVLLIDFLQYGLAYSVPFVLGLRIRQSSGFESKMICLLTVVFFVFSASYCYVHYPSPWDLSNFFKSPPHYYYISYGLMMCSLLWITRNLWVKYLQFDFFVWIGQNTIWVYLWHMPFALLANLLPFPWFVKFFFVSSTAVGLYSIQYWIVKKLNNRFLLKYLIG